MIYLYNELKRKGSGSTSCLTYFKRYIIHGGWGDAYAHTAILTLLLFIPFFFYVSPSIGLAWKTRRKGNVCLFLSFGMNQNLQ